MPVTPSERDIEQGNSDAEDSREPFLGAAQIRNIRSSEEFSAEEWGADCSLPSCSNFNENNFHSKNASTEPPKYGDSSPASERQEDLNRRLFDALYKAEVNNDEVQKLLHEGADPNATCNEHGGDVYACHYAGLFEKYTLNFMKVTDALSHASENWTPLHVAAYFTLPTTVRLLLDAKADLNICDDRGRTPLDVTGLVQAIPIRKNLHNFTEVIQLLIDAGGEQNTMIGDHVKRDQTPLHTAVELGDQDALDLLLGHGASVGCWNKEGLTPLHLCTRRTEQRRGLEQIFKVLIFKGPNVVDSNGETALRAAITHGWLEGVLIALDAKADVTFIAKDGETPLHIMAQDIAGWYDIRQPPCCDYEIHEKDLRDEVLDNIVRVAKNNNAIDCFNEKGLTPLFSAVRHGKYLIAQKLLLEGASIRHTAANGINLLHVAAKHGHAKILKMLLNFDEDSTKVMINSLTESQGYGPIHFAVAGNHLPCVDAFYLINGTDFCLKTGINKIKWIMHYPKDTTPLHMAAANDNVDIATTLIRASKFEKERTFPLGKEDGNGWLPLHSAISKSSVNIIKYFVIDLNESLAESTRSKKPETALDMIIQHVTNPTEFLEDLFDSCISFYLPNKVKISYRILIPQSSVLSPNKFLKVEMDVVEALLKTGNEFDQKRLLLHPLIESFIYLKWQTMKPYYFLIASVYTLLLAILVGFELSVFNDKDICKEKPSLFKSIAGGFIIYFLTILIILQELLMNFEGRQYFRQWRSWFKLGSLVPAFVVPPAITASETAEWPRHVATLALFLVCLQMMNLLSQFPKWGYYVVMFKKVAFNVVKILASFSILIFCFAFSFKIQFRSEYPFDGPWGAIVKTLFMLSAEFEYNDVFESKNAAKLGSSFEVVRIILLVFLVLAAIVLMNMMVGVAVDDINELKAHGHIGRLEKQAYFVRSLDRLNDSLQSVLCWMPQRCQRNEFPLKIILAGDILTQEPDYGYNIEGLPKRFKDAFYKIAQKNKEKKDDETSKDVQHETEKNKNFFLMK